MFTIVDVIIVDITNVDVLIADVTIVDVIIILQPDAQACFAAQWDESLSLWVRHLK